MESTQERSAGRDEAKTCPGCRSALHEHDLIWDCPACKATHHVQCANVHGKCAVLGCQGMPPAPQTQQIGDLKRQFVTTRRDDSIVTRTRTPEVVWASFFVKALTGCFLMGQALWRFLHASDNEGIVFVVNGTMMPFVLRAFLGAITGLAPLREIGRIREQGYEKRVHHIPYLIVLTILTVTLLGLCISAPFNPDAFVTLAWTAVVAFLIDIFWPH